MQDRSISIGDVFKNKISGNNWYVVAIFRFVYRLSKQKPAHYIQGSHTVDETLQELQTYYQPHLVQLELF